MDATLAAGSRSFLGSEFDAFLFAPIGEDKNGMLLSVVSALARMDVDPWQEARSLARLPRETATEKLAALIAALPDGPSAQFEPRTIAARLIALLPRGASSNVRQGGTTVRPRETSLGLAAASKSRAVLYMLFLAVMLIAQCTMASRQQPAQVDDAHAPASSADSARPQPPTVFQHQTGTPTGF